ncbi:MAG: excinuclease ABC subunit UvrA [bacterium]|nr:excinuclease ABC subunit UvrA [bacterium]
MSDQNLNIRGAREHNLKDISVSIPKYKLVVFTGISGSGKSSLAFDTIYAEGQRRYVESLSAYARQFLGVMDKPDVDLIEGLSPAISIDQKGTSHNPRSTVGTVTEIYDYLRLLFARVGHPHCPECGREISQVTSGQIVDQILKLVDDSLKTSKLVKFMVLSPIVRDRKGEFSQLFENLRSKGFMRIRLDNEVRRLDEELILIKTNKHTVEAVIDRVSLDKNQLKSEVAISNLKTRLSETVEQALKLSDGLVIFSEIKDASFEIAETPKKMNDHLFSQKFACPVCNLSLSEIEPRSFSFNSPHGACPTCTGLGTLLKVDEQLIINPHLSLSEGGILPFSKMFVNDTWFARLVKTAAEDHGINLRLPMSNMSPEQSDVLFFGTGEETYRVQGSNRFGHETSIVETYPGIIPELERRYRETESDYVRREIEKYMREEVCPDCHGARLRKETLSITLDGQTIVNIVDMTIVHAQNWFEGLTERNALSLREKTIAAPIFKEIKERLSFLTTIGLEYLTLSRPTQTLAGGEAQRIRLASQLGSGLSGVLYVLDEPSIGLHPRDNGRLIKTLKRLRDLGNSVIVVEHDREIIEEADYILDFGPGAGEHGGNIIAQGTPQEIMANPNSITGGYLSGKKKIKMLGLRVISNGYDLKISGCSQFNLKNINVAFPLGKLICLTGVSGSGKSTLLNETLYLALKQHFNSYSREKPGAFKNITGLEHLNRVILIDQSPIGRTPRSNPATYTGLFNYIRDLFAKLPEARVRGYRAGRFSFNVPGGRCEACRGEGQVKIEMQFLPDIYVNCEVCGGKRYNSETLEVAYKGKNIAEILEMTVEESREFFMNIPGVAEKLQVLADVGLNYIHLGQPAPTLSGGEAQRVKISSELGKRSTGKTFYLLDEPTTGLHFADIEKLLAILRRLVDIGNTVVVIEHNLDVVKNADWIIDLGPEGGDGGGYLVAQGTPREISQVKESYTGQFLNKAL